MYEIILSKRSAKNLKKLSGKDREKILRALFALKEDPFLGKPLIGELKGLYSLRVWPYRIVYEIIKNKLLIHVLHVGHRKDVYKKINKTTLTK